MAKNKYNAKRTEYNGVMYDSKKEAGFAKKLDLLMYAKDPKHKVYRVDRQVPFQITVNHQKIAKYILDFKVTYEDRVEYIDVKGMKSGAAYQMFKLKKKLVEALYDIEIIEV